MDQDHLARTFQITAFSTSYPFSLNVNFNKILPKTRIHSTHLNTDKLKMTATSYKMELNESYRKTSPEYIDSKKQINISPTASKKIRFNLATVTSINGSELETW